MTVLSAWPNAAFAVLLALTWCLIRPLAGRTTLSIGRFVQVFVLGAVGTTAASLILHQIPIIWLTHQTVSWTFGPPIEELTKAAPVLLLAYVFADRWRLTIADFVLIGFTTGLGFAFAETNFYLLAFGQMYDVQGLQWFGFLPGMVLSGTPVHIAGHALWTALIALGAGIGVRFCSTRWSWAPCAAAFAIATFHHVLANRAFVAAGDGIGFIAPDWVLSVYALFLNGRIELLLVPVGLLIASALEARGYRASAEDRRALLLRRERWAVVPIEWLHLVRRLGLGWSVTLRTHAFFRRRRALDLVSATARGESSDASLPGHAEALRGRLVTEKVFLDDPAPSGWLPPRSAPMRWLKRFAVFGIVQLAVVIFLMLGNRFLSAEVRAVLYGRPVRNTLAAIAVALVLWRIVVFLRRDRPNPVTADEDALLQYRLQAMLLGASALSAGLAFLVMYADRDLLNNASAIRFGFITDRIVDWVSRGGDATTYFALASAVASTLPDPTPAEPIAAADAQAAVERVKEEFEQLQEQLRAQAVDDLDALDAFMTDYDDKWKTGMSALEEYIGAYRGMVPGLQKIWEAVANRETAMKIAQAVDVALQAASVGVGVARQAGATAAKQAVSGGVRAGQRAAARAAERAAAREFELKVARQAEEARRLGTKLQADAKAIRAAAKDGVALDAKAARQAAEAERLGAKLQAEAVEIEANARKLADEVAARKAAATRARNEAEERLLAAGAKPPPHLVEAAEKARVIEEITHINPGYRRLAGHETNCYITSYTYEQQLRGAVPTTASPDVLGTGSPRLTGPDALETLYGGKFRYVGEGASGKAALDKLLADNPGARGIVNVAWGNAPGQELGHAFNAINRKGLVLYPDAQAANLFDQWADVRGIWFLPTH
jgi:RsiW-degrading membrane proteinase PrsW (M82 family)